ncbi:MAG: thiamine pyrophosphate-dependent dehydrogenase E1 component subunit alpha [Planctomycetota bacterium]
MASALQILAPDGSVVGEAPGLSDAELKDLFVHMLRIRCLDGRMLKLQRAGRIGFVGTATGLEAALVGAAAPLRSTDWLWSGLREGGAAVMRGLPLAEYVAQMYCNANDTAKGRQMCNHFQHAGTNYPSWSSVIGTQIPHGVGAAFATKKRGEDAVHAIHFGDGATSSNGFHSGMNFASVWKVPAVFVCTDNGWAISVASSEQTAAESYADKAKAYGMPGREVDGNDVLACEQAMREAVDAARAGEGPSLLVLRTYRMLGHSSSDDPTKYRSAEEVESWAQRDPITRFERFLVERGVLGAGEHDALEAELTAEIDAVIHEQEAAPPMALKTLVEDVYQDVPYHLRRQYNDFIAVAEKLGHAQPGDGAFPL